MAKIEKDHKSKMFKSAQGTKIGKKREFETYDEYDIEVKRIKIEFRPDYRDLAIARMANIIENDSKFIRFSIMILVVMMAVFLTTITYLNIHKWFIKYTV